MQQKIHWGKWLTTSDLKSDLKISRSGYVDFNANTIDLWFLFIVMINSPENNPGHINFIPCCATWRTLSLWILMNQISLRFVRAYNISSRIHGAHSIQQLRVGKRNLERKQSFPERVVFLSGNTESHPQRLKIQT